MRRNGGKIKSDMSGKELVPATQSKLNVTPDPLEVQIDHIKPRSSGESNSYSNAQVLSREENIFKSNKWGKIMFDIDENTMVITTVDIINKKKKTYLSSIKCCYNIDFGNGADWFFYWWIMWSSSRMRRFSWWWNAAMEMVWNRMTSFISAKQ